MADGYLNFDTKINTKGFKNGLGNIEKGLSSLKSSLTSIASAVGIAFSTTALVNFSKACEQAYQTQITQEVKLATVMKQRMNASEQEIKSIKEQASAQQELGIIGDEVQLAGAQQMATFLNESDSLKQLIPAMNNLLAQQKGLNAQTGDAVSIGNMFGKVMQGQTSALTRVGITFSEAEEQVLKFGNETERAAMLAKVITNNVGEMNSVLAQTDMGRQKQLSNTLGDIQEQFGAAVTQIEILFLPALSKLAAFLSNVASQAQRVAQALSVVFGSSKSSEVYANPGSELAETTEITADTSSEVADNFDKVSESAKETEEAIKGSLNAFDELNVLSKDDNTAISLDEGNVKDEINNIANGINENEGLQLSVGLDTGSFENEVDTFVEKLKQKWEELKNLCRPLEDAFDRLKSTLSEIGGFAGDNLTNFYEHFLKPLGDWALGEGLPKFVDIVNKTLQNIDFEKINTALDNLYTTLEPFAEDVGEGLLWFCDNVLSPLSSWVVDEAVPAFLKTVSGALELIDKVGKSAGEILVYIWDNFLSKVAEWAGDAITGFLEVLGQFLSDVSENQTAVTVILSIAAAIGTAAAAFLLLKNAMIAYQAISLVLNMTNPLGWIVLAITAIIVVIIEVITYWDTLKELWQTGVEMWKSGAKDIFNSLKAIWNKAVQWFTEKFPGLTSSITEYVDGIKRIFTGVIDFVKGVFSGDWEKAWNGVKKIFSGVWSSLSAVIKAPINLIIDLINNFIGGIENKLNSLIDCINNLSFDIPDWVPGIGGDHIGFSLGYIDIPDIPHLATGTVVPANYGEFAAILGDNKREAEVVSPLSTMKQAMIEALAEVGLAGGNNDSDIVINIDGKEVFRAVRKQNDSHKRTHGGKSALA